jgi:hypothetical protein
LRIKEGIRNSNENLKLAPKTKASRKLWENQNVLERQNLGC